LRSFTQLALIGRRLNRNPKLDLGSQLASGYHTFFEGRFLEDSTEARISLFRSAVRNLSGMRRSTLWVTTLAGMAAPRMFLNTGTGKFKVGGALPAARCEGGQVHHCNVVRNELQILAHFNP
jgi:hypothetical protein